MARLRKTYSSFVGTPFHQAPSFHMLACSWNQLQRGSMQKEHHIPQWLMGDSVVLMKGLYRPLSADEATLLTGPGTGFHPSGAHRTSGGWDFSSKGDKEFTLGGISLMSSLQVEGLSGIHHSQGGRQCRALGPMPQGSILSGNFRTLPGLKTRMENHPWSGSGPLCHPQKPLCLFMRT